MKEAEELSALCRENNITLCSCESLTAGMFASLIAGVPGASAILKGGLVTYFTEMKTVLAHVPQPLIETYGVVSEQCARAMAENTRKIMEADYCVSFTGNAGPEAMEGKPAGRVYCAIADENQVCISQWNLDLPRNELRKEVCRLEMVKLMEIIYQKMERRDINA